MQEALQRYGRTVFVDDDLPVWAGTVPVVGEAYEVPWWTPQRLTLGERRIGWDRCDPFRCLQAAPHVGGGAPCVGAHPDVGAA